MKDALPILVIGLIAFLLLSNSQKVGKPGDPDYMRSKGYVKQPDGTWVKVGTVN